MAKQVIKIDCPDGMKPIWKGNKIEFVPINPIEAVTAFKLDGIEWLD